MIGYVTLGTNDLARSAAFYDALLAEIGAKRVMENERMIAWCTKPGQPMLAVIKPFDKKEATVGNGINVPIVTRRWGISIHLVVPIAMSIINRKPTRNTEK